MRWWQSRSSAYVDDARSAERGQYSFLQGLLRHGRAGARWGGATARPSHLAVARQLQTAGASSQARSPRCLPATTSTRSRPSRTPRTSHRSARWACETLEEAGKRAISLALGPEARRHFENAAKLAEDPAVKGRLLREAGNAAAPGDRHRGGAGAVRDRVADARDGQLRREQAVVEGLAGTVLLEIGRADEAGERLARAYETLDDGSQDEAFAEVAAIRARRLLTGDPEAALRFIDVALSIAERLRLGRVLVDAMTTKSIALAERGHPAEATALLTHATTLAIEQDLGSHAIRSLYNLAENKMAEARFTEADELLDRGLRSPTNAATRAERGGVKHSESGPDRARAVGRGAGNARAIRAAQQDDQWAYQALVFTQLVLVAEGRERPARALLETDRGRHRLV